MYIFTNSVDKSKLKYINSPVNDIIPINIIGIIGALIMSLYDSVLVTGCDENYIYFNDPMTVEVKKAPINDFREAWIQMGNKQLQLQKSQ